MTRILTINILLVLTTSAVAMGVMDDDLFKRENCQDKIGAHQCTGLTRYCTDVQYSYWMEESCQKTCNKCPQPAPKPSVDCNKQEVSRCSVWKRMGYCKSKGPFLQYVNKHCPVTCGLCAGVKITQPKPAPEGVDIKECLQAHNDYRKRHGAPPLTWDRQMASEAQKYADYLSKEKKLEHAKGISDGENLAWQWSASRYTCKQATAAWYKEVKDYSYDNPGFSTKTGHFTQVVWKSTKRLGVGVARNGAETVIVARYNPAGNVHGRFKENVGKPVGT